MRPRGGYSRRERGRETSRDADGGQRLLAMRTGGREITRAANLEKALVVSSDLGNSPGTIHQSSSDLPLKPLAWSLLDDYNPVTMAKSAKIVAAGEFKARCLALLDEVSQTGKPIVVTKRGKPVARVVPVEEPPGLLHSVKKEKDLISPTGEKWDAES